MIEVVNKQRRFKVDTDSWKEFVAKALEATGHRDSGVTVAFVSDRGIRELNRRFREKNRPTDVLSFPSEQTEFEIESERTLGDIVISLETAARQAEENGLEFEVEISQLILHGLLHLQGFDHETDNGEMNRHELKLRDMLGL